MDELKEYISEVFIEINADTVLCRSMCHSVMKRFEARCNVDGTKFEYLGDYTVLKKGM